MIFGRNVFGIPGNSGTAEDEEITEDRESSPPKFAAEVWILLEIQDLLQGPEECVSEMEDPLHLCSISG